MYSVDFKRENIDWKGTVTERRIKAGLEEKGWGKFDPSTLYTHIEVSNNETILLEKKL